MKSKLSKIIFIVYALSLLSNCAIFKGNNLEKVNAEQVIIDAAKKRKIYIKWDFDFSPMGHSSLSYEDREKLFKKVLDESNCCKIVKKKSEADLIFEGKAYDQKNPARMIGFMISAATIYVIPSWHVIKIFVAAEVKNGKEDKHYEVQDSITVAIWLPLIVATPFTYYPDQIQKIILENMYRSIVLKMKNDKLI